MREEEKEGSFSVSVESSLEVFLWFIKKITLKEKSLLILRKTLDKESVFV